MLKELPSKDIDDDVMLITSKQLRHLAGDVSDMTVWRWVKTGVVPSPIKINGRNYWKKQEVISSLVGQE